MHLLTRRTVDSLRSAPPATSAKLVPIQTVSDETSHDADLIPRKRKNPNRDCTPSKSTRIEGKAIITQTPEVISKTMPPLDHLISSKSSMWGDDMSLADMMKGIQAHSEMVRSFSSSPLSAFISILC